MLYLSKDYNPEQIAGRAKIDKIEMVSPERIYQYISVDKRKGVFLFKHLRTKGKKYKKRRNLKDKRGLIAGSIDIDARPSIMEKKNRLGDLEIDLVIGKDHKGALLTINDRALGVLFIGKVESKEAQLIEQKNDRIVERKETANKDHYLG